ncbi:LysR family transcriptional regulator [Rubrivivax albus]|uniref:LysR family transcriptional regulator n=1 Tax=Rubrivivax albus TaxID=2499835 RepID=A0A437JUL3_9BURK|nr:LysR family transcriptional regulator [Rubrivivax albus]RVT50918.1 LysR family transcriptional regulator [Rubrivivax albus]
MDLSTLATFVKVVQTGSFTRAADALQTHKARVSRSVSALERELGVRLLARSTRALSLTEAGREFFERSVGILAAVDEARGAMQQVQGEPRGTLRLTCGVEFGLIAVSGWIRAYLQRHPQVQVDADFTARVVDLVHEGFDLAVRLGPLADSSLAARRLGTLHYALYAAPAYLRRRGTPRRPDDLAAHDTLAFAGTSRRAQWTLSDGAQTHRVDLQPRLHAGNTFAVRDAAEAGLGVALLPCLVAADAVQAGRLKPVLGRWAPPPVPVHAVFPSARFLAPKVRAFVDLAAAVFAGESLPG